MTAVTSIYLHRDGRLLAMEECAYEAETVLQQLLADYPELLTDDDGRLLLVRREAALSDRAEQLNAGWLDHLFLDQHAVPTLVEVKRSSDTRLRRDVVGQMLDYAANAAACWPDATLRAWFAETCAPTDPDIALMAAFPELEDPEAFWADVQTNLRAGRMRLVFVADAIPVHLQRIVEFLNGQLRETDVVAVEVRQYVDASGELQTLVPQVLGQTAAAQQAKGRGVRPEWNRDTVLDALEQRHGPAVRRVGESLFTWSAERGLRFWFGRGMKDGSFQSCLARRGRSSSTFTLYTYGRVEINFQHLAQHSPFDDPALRQELCRRLNEIPGVALPEDSIERRPSIDLATLVPPEASTRFLQVLDWAIDQQR